jgi:transcription termination factor NusB
MDNFLKAWKVYAKEYEKVKTDTEQDFIPTLESMKAYLQAQGLILPKNFNQFWHWFVIKYSDELDEKGLIEITQGMINDFSRERTDELKQGLQPTTPGTSPQAELETTEQKIKRILEPLRGAFDTTGHIDIIIDAFIKLKAGENLPKVNKAILYNMGLKEFIKPFGRLFAEGIFGRGEIAQTLLYYIKKKTFAGDPEYSEGYINRLLSEYKSKP